MGTHPGPPQTRTCGTTAYGSSGHGFATRLQAATQILRFGSGYRFKRSWNFFQGNIFGLPVSGNPEATSLFTFGPAKGASDALSGGDFGLEASAIGSVILTVAIAVAFVRLRRRAATAKSSMETSAGPV